MPRSASQTLPVDFAEALAAAGSPFGAPIHYFEEVDSTSEVAGRLAAAGAREGLVVLAASQTAGRGRRGHHWHSPPDAGLYLSIILRPADWRKPPGDSAAWTGVLLLSLAAGVAVVEGIGAATGLLTHIKWPNDVIVRAGPARAAGERFYGRQRKIAGVLAEAAGGTFDVVVVGLGINLRPAALPPELAERATSLEAELGRAVERGAVLVATLASLADAVAELRAGRHETILERWRARSPSSIGASVEWMASGGVRRGVTDGIDADGALRVRSPAGVERVIAGELTWR
jgi:BirA family transcriptional regulator, biotin operon repressor / biotin---[acetyl-CoA-carboxylase] ligase